MLWDTFHLFRGNLLTIFGELKRRIKLNKNRLKDPTYCAPLIFDQNHEWPGDWQGRAILALANHYAVSTNYDDKISIKNQLDDIITQLKNHLNKDGYFGPLLDLNRINEQQIAGNSWFLRGLCEYQILFRDQYSKRLIHQIVDHYLLKLVDAYQTYPNIKREDGGVGGHLLKMTYNHWQLSSDVGCAFIMLDGVSQVYEITRDHRLVQLINVMIKNFMTLDLLASNCQTHATLSATRGMMRYYRLTKNESILSRVIKVFTLYVNEGMTINYANINWFGKSSWTEPCAVVDSFILAKQLYEVTNKYDYLELMNRIYYNAILVGQRSNGGAGCETCLLSHDDEFKIHTYEAYFCCSMRLAEGLREVADSIMIANANGVTLAIMNSIKKYQIYRHNIEIYVNFKKGTISTLNIRINNPQHIEGELGIYLPKGTMVVSASSVLSKDDLIHIPFTTTHFVLNFKYVSRIETIKSVNVQMLGDYILMTSQSHKHSHMTDYTQLSEEQALKDIQKL